LRGQEHPKKKVDLACARVRRAKIGLTPKGSPYDGFLAEVKGNIFGRTLLEIGAKDGGRKGEVQGKPFRSRVGREEKPGQCQ